MDRLNAEKLCQANRCWPKTSLKSCWGLERSLRTRYDGYWGVTVEGCTTSCRGLDSMVFNLVKLSAYLVHFPKQFWRANKVRFGHEVRILLSLPTEI